jgi:hypothetical protein
MGTSALFWKLPATADQDSCNVTTLSGRKGKKRFRAGAAGGDGWGFGFAPDAWYNLTITETDTGVFVTGLVTSYPSVEAWQHSDSGPPTLVFSNNTAFGPWTGQSSLGVPNYIIAYPVVQNGPVPQ